MPAHMTAKIVIASAKRLIARPPLLPEQEQDRRDQRSGVADTDPEDEVDDRPAPEDRVVAVRAADRLHLHLRVALGLLEVPIDADPVHLAAVQHLVLADPRDVVLRLAGDGAGAAGARVEVDGHAHW
jgi:hypothetical protein